MPKSGFKVVVVGGGPIGLFAAHVLRSAGIDFVVLERRESLVVDVGAALALTPATLRVFHQLDLLQDLLPLGREMEKRATFTLNGHLFDGTIFYYMRKNHGSSIYAFHRADLVKYLYDSLGDERRKIITGKRVENITSSDDGVEVICSDGSTYEGSIVLGTDGVHSKTRRLMRRLALDSDPGIEWDPELPYTSTYKCMFFAIPRPSASGVFSDTESTDRSLFYVTGNDRAWVFLNEKMAQPTEKHISYTAEDAERFAAKFADYPLTKTLKVKDVFSRRTNFGMANLEEGLVKHWSWGRIVLAGDSCHKFTPHAGLGFNNGVQDITVLVNELRRVMHAAQPGQGLSSSQLAEVFQSYQVHRHEPVKADAFISALMTRLQTWATTLCYIMSRYIAPLRLWQYYIWNHVAPRGMRMAPILDHVAAQEPFLGEIEWDNKMKVPEGGL